MTLARLIIRISALLSPRSDRSRFTEEWLAELDAVAGRGSGAAFRFALGAISGAWSTRESSRLFSAIGADLKYTWRQLLRRPSYTLVVIACLVAGLFVSIGTISVFESMLTGDKPGVHNRQALTQLFLTFEGADSPGVPVHPQRTGALVLDEFRLLMADQLPPTSSFSALGVESTAPMSLTGLHGPVAGRGAFVSSDYFKALATERGPAGRLLDASDRESMAAVVTEHFWRTQLDSAPDAIGQPILISGMSVTVVGVAPHRFHGMLSDDVGDDDSRGTQVWMPLAMAPRWPGVEPQTMRLVAYGRLKAGRTPAQAEAELAGASRRIAETFPDQRRNAALLVRPEPLPADRTPFQLVLSLAMVMVLPLTILAIGCANVANLQLARVAERSRELAVRLSLGASRGQLIRLVTLETLARAVVAVALSLALIQIAIGYVQPYFPAFLAIKWGTAAFAIGLALVVAVGTGLMPAWTVLRKTAAGQLKQSAQSGGLGHSKMRAALVVTQVALSLCLLVATALIVNAVGRMAASAPPALRTQVVASFDAAAIGMTPEEGRRFADRIAERALADTRISRVALSETTGASFAAPQQSGNNETPMVSADLVGISASWLDVMDVKVLTGRRLDDHDDESSVLLSAHAAEMVSSAGSALGMTLNLQTGKATTRQVRVVGIVADTPTQPTIGEPDPVIYTVLPKTFRKEFVFRAQTTSPDAVSADLRKLIPTIDPRVSWTSLRRGDMRFEDEAGEVTILAVGVAVCGTIALILSATGLFAVMSYIVTLRRREIGVRLAIGAAPAQIVGMVMRQGVKLVAIGAGIGLAVGIPLAFMMRAEFAAGIEPGNPRVFAPALGLLFAVGAVAAALPALRASRVDPISTLRQD